VKRPVRRPRVTQHESRPWEDLTQRYRDVSRLKRRGSHVGQQRTVDEVVSRTDQHQVGDIRRKDPLLPPQGVQPSEPTTNNDDLWTLRTDAPVCDGNHGRRQAYGPCRGRKRTPFRDRTSRSSERSASFPPSPGAGAQCGGRPATAQMALSMRTLQTRR
jgi:hypothetical protein